MATTAPDTRDIIETALRAEAENVWRDLVSLLDGLTVEKTEEITLDVIFRHDGHRVTSRSTSLVSNLVADIRRATASAFLFALREANRYGHEDKELRDHLTEVGNFRINDIVR